MAKKWSVLRDKLSQNPEAVALIAEKRAEMEFVLRVADGMQALRERRGLTQIAVASAMRTQQPNVSRIENAEDLYLSSLSQYVTALGGTLELRVNFPDESVILARDEKRESPPTVATSPA